MNNWWLFLLLLVTSVACTSSNVQQQNLSYLYPESNAAHEIDFQYRYVNDSTVELMLELPAHQIAFVKNEDSLLAKLTMDWKFTATSAQSNNFNASKKTLILQRSVNDSSVYQDTLRLLVNGKDVNHFHFNIKDELSERVFARYEVIPSLSPWNWFRWCNLGSLHIQPDDAIRVFNSRSTAEIQCYYGNRGINPPPYYVYYTDAFDFILSEKYSYTNISGEFLFNPKRKGFFLHLDDTLSEEGQLFTSFSENFPFVSTPEEMLAPLQLITSSQEFKNFGYMPNLKLAIDNFWIDRCGSKDKARKVIDRFYGRVEEANHLFTDIKEGWKTDRGLIYVIYGPPSKVSKSKDLETWSYGGEGNLVALSFTFQKIYNPFHPELYQMIRNAAYKNSWYRMIDAWRDGRIYTSDE